MRRYSCTSLPPSLPLSLLLFLFSYPHFRIPISTPPYMDLIPAHAHDLHLILAGADNSHEALHLLHEKQDEELLKMAHELRDFCLVRPLSPALILLLPFHLAPPMHPFISSLLFFHPPQLWPLAYDIFQTHFGLHRSKSRLAAPPPPTPSTLPPPPPITEPLFGIHASQIASLPLHHTKYGKPIPAGEIPIRIRRGAEDGLHGKEKLAREARYFLLSSLLPLNHFLPLYLEYCSN